jgi:hypothetical protein
MGLWITPVGTCANSKIYPNSTIPNGVVNNVCNYWSYCDVIAQIDMIYSQPSAYYHCQNNPLPPPSTRYPGDYCSNNSDCYRPITPVTDYTPNCKNKICQGF